MSSGSIANPRTKTGAEALIRAAATCARLDACCRHIFGGSSLWELLASLGRQCFHYCEGLYQLLRHIVPLP